MLAVSFSDWLGVFQAALTAVSVIFAWLAIRVALETKHDADSEKRRARLLELRTILGEIYRLYEYGAPMPQRDKEKERLAAELRTVGGAKKFPKAAKIVDFAMPMGMLTDDGVKMLDEARTEVDEAIDKAFVD